MNIWFRILAVLLIASAVFGVGYRRGWYDGLHTCQDKSSRVTMGIEECDTNESGAETGAKAGAQG